MGVTASASDGLMTLSDKVLDIEPSVAELELDLNLTLTTPSNTVYSTENITLTSILTAGYDDTSQINVDLNAVLTGATVIFKEGNTTLGTGITNSSGIATATISPLTVGSHTIKAVFEGTNNFDSCESTSITLTCSDPDYDAILLSTETPIVSYADNENIVLSAQLMKNGQPLTAGGIRLYKNSDIVTDYQLTNSNGIATFTIPSTGDGDRVFDVKNGGTASGYSNATIWSNQITIEDCWNTFLEEGSVTEAGTALRYRDINMNLVHNVQNDNFELIFDHKDGGGLCIGPHSTWTSGTNTSSYQLRIGKYASSLAHRVVLYTNGTSTSVAGGALTLDTWYTYKITRENTDVSFYEGNRLITTQTIDWILDYDEWDIYNYVPKDTNSAFTSYFKNVRLKKFNDPIIMWVDGQQNLTNIILDSSKNDTAYIKGFVGSYGNSSQVFLYKDGVYWFTAINNGPMGPNGLIYQSTGAGDVIIEARFGNYSKTLLIEDYIVYGLDSWTGSYTTGTDTYDYITPTAKSLTPNITLPSTFEITYKFKSTADATAGNSLWIIGTDSDNGVVLGGTATSHRVRLYTRANGTNTSVGYKNNAYTLNEWTDVKIVYDGTDISITMGSYTLSTALASATMMMLGGNYSSTLIANFNLKKL